MQNRVGKTEYIAFGLSLLCLLSIYIFPDEVRSASHNAVILCGRVVIPSVFPYIVLTRIFLCRFTDIFSKKQSDGTGKGEHTAIYAAMLLGMISGFPTGTAVCGQMHKSGLFSKETAEKCAVFSSVASPSLCINFFGSEIMHSRLAGLCAYVSSLFSAILLFLLFTSKKKASLCNRSETSETYSEEKETVCGIIYDSCMTVLAICAYVTFFKCLGEVICKMIDFIADDRVKDIFTALFTGICEITSGTASLTSLDFSRRFLIGCSFIGFCGISGIMQIISVGKKYGLDCSKAIYVKLLSAFTVPIFSFMLLLASGMISSQKSDLNDILSFVLTCITITIILIFVIFIKKQVKKYKKSKVNL